MPARNVLDTPTDSSLKNREIGSTEPGRVSENRRRDPPAVVVGRVGDNCHTAPERTPAGTHDLGPDELVHVQTVGRIGKCFGEKIGAD